MTVTTNGAQATRSRGITYQELLDTDTHPVPAVLRLRSDDDFGAQDVPVERYISRDFHELEKERLWSNANALCIPVDQRRQVGAAKLNPLYGECEIIIFFAATNFKHLGSH